MYRYLDQHPDVYMPRVKEPHWFSRVEPSSHLGEFPVTSEAEYCSLFEDWRGERAVGEASPSYLWNAMAPDRIKRSVPDAKIIILLREPMDRAVSHYLMDMNDGIQDRPFLEALQEDYASREKGWGVSHLYVELGLYCDQVSRYLERFGPEKVLVLFFEEVFADPEATERSLKRVLTFLDLDPEAADDIQTRKQHNPHISAPRNALLRFALNAPGLRTLWRSLPSEKLKETLKGQLLAPRAEKPEIEPEAIEFLRRVYDPDIASLEEVLDRESPWEASTRTR